MFKVMHFYQNPANNYSREYEDINDAIKELQRFASENNSSSSHLTNDGELIAYHNWEEDGIVWFDSKRRTKCKSKN